MENVLSAWKEIVFRRRTGNCLEIDMYIGRNFFFTSIADGVIISTASGCSNYSSSAGGMVMHPQIKGYMITPINSVKSWIKPLVVPHYLELSFRVNAKNRTDKVDITFDGIKRVTIGKEHVISMIFSKKYLQRFIFLLLY